MATASGASRCHVGQKVRIRSVDPSKHSRVPGFIEGQVGEVSRYWGDFPNPESLSQGRRSDPLVPVYLVVFEPRVLWPDSAPQPGDRVLVDVYGHDLEGLGT